MQTNSSRVGMAVLVMLVTPLMFSTNLVFGRMVVQEVAPFTLAFIRWAIVALALAPFALRALPEIRRTAGRGWLLIVLLGFLGMWICGAIVYLGLSRTTATNGALIYTTSPVIIILIEALFRGRKVGPREAVGCAFAFLGVATILLRGDPAALFALDLNPGDVLILAAAFAWAAYGVIYRAPALSALPNMALFALIAAAGAVLILPVAAWEIASGAPLPSRVEPQLAHQVRAAARQMADRKISARFVVACCDAPEILEPAKHALDEVAATIGVAVVGVRVLAGGVGRDNGFGSPFGEPVAQAGCVIGAVGQQLVAWTADGEQGLGAGEVVGIAGRQGEGDRPAAVVAQRMDFGRASTARGANGMMTSPPFAPAAERWALMWVDSTQPVNTLVGLLLVSWTPR